MKKVIYMLTAFVAVLLSSCSNDDIAVSRKTTFTVAPTSVIAPFTDYEVNKGDLETVPSDMSLRVQIFIYDTDGKLAGKLVSELDQYTNVMKESLDLPTGDYTAVVTTDVHSPSVYYWEFENMENLSGATIQETGYLGYAWKILGLQVGTFSVNGEETADFLAEPVAYGALFIVTYYNVQNAKDYDKVGLAANRNAESLTFNSIGGFNPSVSIDSSYAWWNNFIRPNDYTSNNLYGYSFVLPINNYGVRWEGETTSGKYYTLNENEWVFDVASGDVYSFSITFGSSSSAPAKARMMSGGNSVENNTASSLFDGNVKAENTAKINLSEIVPTKLKSTK
jgi:hypothetical protein